MTKYYIEIGASGGWGFMDYQTKLTAITKSELNKFKPLIEAIKKHSKVCYANDYDGDPWIPFNWPEHSGVEDDPFYLYKEVYGIATKLVVDFSDYVPYGKCGMHTINTIKIIEVKNETVIELVEDNYVHDINF